MRKAVRKILSQQQNRITQAAFVLGILVFVSQLLGVVRDRLLAHYIGSGADLDVYATAFRVPDIIYTLIGSMVSVSVLIPLFAEAKASSSDGTKKAIAVLGQILTVFIGLMVIVSIIMYFVMPAFSPLIAPGFGTAQHELLTKVSRIMLLSPLFLGISNIMSTITQTERRFLVFGLSPVVYNLGIIAGVAFLYPWLGVSGIAIGVIIGAMLHVGIQLPSIIARKQIPRLSFNIDWKLIKSLVFISLPRTITLSLNRIGLLVFVAMASTIGEGAVSILHFANNLQNVPLALIGMSISVAAFPKLVELATQKNTKTFQLTVTSAVRQVIVWSIPLLVVFIVLRAHIVRLILGSGRFDWSDTRLTAAALALFVLSVVAQGLSLVFIRAFYATGRTWRPLWATLFSTSLGITLSYVFIHWYGEGSVLLQNLYSTVIRGNTIDGIAVLAIPLAFSIGSLVQAVLLWKLYVRQTRHKLWTELNVFIAKNVITALVMGVAIYGALFLMGPNLNTRTVLGILIHGALGGVAGIMVWIAMAKILYIQPILTLVKKIKRRLTFSKKLANKTS